MLDIAAMATAILLLSQMRFYVVPLHMSTRFMERLHRGNIEYDVHTNCDQERQLQRSSRRMSNHKPLVVVLPRKKMAHD